MNEKTPDTAPPPAVDTRAWWRQLNKYHWYVFVLCSLGWLFDTMDQKIFTASRMNALTYYMPDASFQDKVDVGGWVTCVFILGWATGGLVFGVIGDKIGRAKTMAITILVYAFFTGFSAFARNTTEFAICRFLTGMGVGGEFAAGASLLAEVIPNSARAQAMGMLQALSAVGNVLGAFLFKYIEPHFGWRTLYLVGAAPALLAVFVRFGMKEPDSWLRAKDRVTKARERGEKATMGGLGELFANRELRRNAFVGMSLAIAGVIAVWSISFYMPELINSLYPANFNKDGTQKVQAILDAQDLSSQTSAIAGLTGAERSEWVKLVKSVKAVEAAEDGSLNAPLSGETRKILGTVLYKSKLIGDGEIYQQIGAFFGMLCFAYMAVRFGRRRSFLVAFILAWASVIYVVTQFQKPSDILYMWPLLGFCTLLPFGGYAIYFPELFPTRLRTTGTGLCYNVGRYVSAFGPVLLGSIGKKLAGKTEMHSFRVALLILSCCYLVGLIALIWAPETADKPLPEDEKGFSH